MRTHCIGIVAHRSRFADADKLCGEVDAVTINYDDNIQQLGAEANHRIVWDRLARHHSLWSVVMEDDAIAVDGFTTQLTQALAVAPTPVVSLYLGTSRRLRWAAPIQRALHEADVADACWLVGTELLHAVGVAIHTELVADMLAWKSSAPIDEAVGAWAKARGHRISYTVPSIVDHRDGPTLINHRDGPRHLPRVAHRFGARTTWDETAVAI